MSQARLAGCRRTIRVRTCGTSFLFGPSASLRDACMLLISFRPVNRIESACKAQNIGNTFAVDGATEGLGFQHVRLSRGDDTKGATPQTTLFAGQIHVAVAGFTSSNP